MRFLFGLYFAGLIAVFSTSSIALDLPARSAPLIAKMHALPGAQQKVLVMGVFQDVSTSFETIETDTPRKRLQALEIHAVALDLLAGLAKQASCHECETWFQEGRDVLVQRIRGELKNGDQLNVWAKGFPKILGDLRARYANDPGMTVPPSEEFKTLRSKLSLDVSAYSKLAIWGGKRKSGEPFERSQAVQDELASLLKASEDAAKPLLALPKKERGTALLASSGALNRLLQGKFGEAEGGDHKEKELAFHGAERALQKLAALAVGMGFRKAEACHLEESKQMRSLARGQIAHPLGCRPAVYSEEMRSEAQDIAAGPHGKEIGDLTTTWAKATYLYAVMAVKYED